MAEKAGILGRQMDNEWETKKRHTKENKKGENVNMVHVVGEGMINLYEGGDILHVLPKKVK